MMIYLPSNLLNSWVLSPFSYRFLCCHVPFYELSSVDELYLMSFSYKDNFSLEAGIKALSSMVLPYKCPRDLTNKTKPNSCKNISYTQT